MEENIRDAYIANLTVSSEQQNFLALFSEKFHYAQRHHQPLALLQMDVDHFKPYVNQCGENAAQHLLLKINNALRDIFSEKNIVYHTGHDEFFVILPMTSLSEALRLAEKSRKYISALNISDTPTIPIKNITVSVGLYAQIPQFTQKADQWLTWTQEALTTAKQTGRNCSRIISHDEYNEFSCKNF